MGVLDFFKSKKQPEERGYVDHMLGLNVSSNDVLVTPESALSFSAIAFKLLH